MKSPRNNRPKVVDFPMGGGHVGSTWGGRTFRRSRASCASRGPDMDEVDPLPAVGFGGLHTRRSTKAEQGPKKSKKKGKHSDLKLQCNTCLFKASSTGAMAEHEAAGHTSTLSNDTLRFLKIDSDRPSTRGSLSLAWGSPPPRRRRTDLR
ncbi:uncharacterized protein A4U43_C07F35720 [Asparagus officinalis]|uniref:Uncharacterized protein n=1 Tax=Asparagus officinalis TaxID=4686 RepID=A0A5P1EL40_ASPOF|nr:uncharacterized protein A4U43_C07F35720 [Asparagus officinalis]